jgi:hypothetical protein
MSRRPIARSQGLERLQKEGYTLRIVGGKLVVDDVPFVDHEGAVRHDGALVMPLTLAGERTTPPGDHTAHFIGGVPCDRDGVTLNNIINNTRTADLGDGLVASCYFSAKPKPTGKYSDYHQKVTVYVAHIAGPASALDPSATAKRFRPIVPDEDDDGPFKYLDTASSRSGIDALNEKLKTEKVAIIGLGGTGEYIFDFVAKTHVAEIHPFDDDRFLTHNAFRAPGAATLGQLDAGPLKVDHFADVYGSMRSGIVPHSYRIDETNVDELRDMSFVFIAIDDAPSKEPIVDALLKFGIPFIDVGMGVEMINDRLTGVVRTTTGTPEKYDHIPARISFAEAETDADYRSNIQIAEINALNASHAVIRWKKYRVVYADLGTEHHSTFSIATNHTINDDRSIADAEPGDVEDT